jgi:DNA-binding FadR family transcriptional regulator
MTAEPRTAGPATGSESDIARPDKRAAQIARHIEADIIRRGWPIGESLGSEQALQHRYRVSRSVLREAVRLVEHHRVARMRRGPNGGLFVTEPDAAPATRAVVIYLEYLGVTLGDLLNARLLLEPLAAALAAERIDEAGIDRLRAVLQAEEHQKSGSAASRDDFHVALAEHSKNPVLHLFIDILMRLTVRFAQVSLPDTAGDAATTLKRTHHDHSAIVAAATAGDSARAKTLTEQHVQSVTAWLHRHHSSGRAMPTRPRRPDISEASPGKLAETLAATIQDEIATSGWRLGSVVGNESQLLERYRVSRSVFREAVRLLEYHAVARMRRGPGGGLVVTKPQAQASIDTIALYLQYRRPTREDLRSVRDAIEIDNVAQVVKRRKDQDVQAFLGVHRHPADQTSDDLRIAEMAEFFFHTGVAQLAGNAVLELFLRILVELFRRQWTSLEQRPVSGADAIEVVRAHQRIIEAIVDGDDSLASYRTRRHLDAAVSWWI